MINSIRTYLNQCEPLLFEQSSPGKRAYQLPPLDVPAIDPAAALFAKNVRAEIVDFPEVSEVETIRHFTRLSTQNCAIDLGLCPLGSCTTKYSPRINEHVARIEGLAWAHPYQPEWFAQGIMDVMAALERMLAEITGMDAVTLQPAAGAHGEFTGILMVRALLESQGRARKKLLIPDSAHGTYSATAAMVGYAVQNIKCNARGMIDVHELSLAVDEDSAALMSTNPNMHGVFEEQITSIAEILHAKGAQLYMDGDNMNALVGIARPGDFGVDLMHLNLHKTFSTPHGGGLGSGPVAVRRHLIPFLPKPVLNRVRGRWSWNYDLPQSVGRVRAFYGNVGMHIRALAYIMAHGGDGLRRATLDAVLNSTYLRALLEPHYDLSYQALTLPQSVFSNARQASRGISSSDIAKRLIDYGFHSDTVNFPLTVPGAMMIEPTETESKAELDRFVNALIAVAKEVDETPDLVLTAPHSTRTSRVDETNAARKPMLRWKR